MRALIVTDVQIDFCEGGNLAVTGGTAVAERITKLIESDGYPVIAFTKDWHVNPGNHFALWGAEPDYVDSWPVHCVAGTKGADLNWKIRDAIHTRLMKAEGNYIDRRKEHPQSYQVIMDTFAKGQYAAAYSGFEGVNSDNVPLEIWLRQHRVDVVDIVGLAFDYCVKATALAAVDYNFQTRVLMDYTASVHPDKDNGTTEVLQDYSVEVVVGE